MVTILREQLDVDLDSNSSISKVLLKIATCRIHKRREQKRCGSCAGMPERYIKGHL